MVEHRKFPMIQEQYVRFSHIAKCYQPVPNCIDSVTEEQHFEPRTQESMTEVLSLARNFSIDTFWLGIVFDQDLDRQVMKLLN